MPQVKTDPEVSREAAPNEDEMTTRIPRPRHPKCGVRQLAKRKPFTFTHIKGNRCLMLNLESCRIGVTPRGNLMDQQDPIDQDPIPEVKMEPSADYCGT